MRAEIEAIPDGVYTFADAIEDDGITDRDYPIELALTIDGGDVIADFTGSAAQAVGPVNAIYAVTASAIYNAFLHLTDPTIPRNEGCYRPFTIIAPPGTIVNCSFPAPVAGGNTETSPRITDMVFGALQDAIPDRGRRIVRRHLVAVPLRRHRPAHGRAVRALPLRGRRLGRAQGPRRQQHGRDDQRQLPQHARSRSSRPGTPRSGSSRTGSSPDSGGPGEFRGGLGGERIFTVTVPEVTVSALLNRMKTEPWGVLGRRRGRGRRALGAPRRAPRSGGRSSRSSGRCRRRSSRGVTLRTGDQVKILMPGGGGYGDPLASRPRRGAARRRGGLRQRGSRSRASTGWRRGDVGEWKAGEISLPQGEPRGVRPLRSPDRRSATGAPRSTASELTFCSPDARAALPRLLAAPLRSEGGRLDDDRASPCSRRTRRSPRAATRRAIVAGGFLYLAGQGPYDAAGERVGDDDRRAGAAGAARTSTRSRAQPAARCRTPFACGMYISDMAHFDEMDAEYRTLLRRADAGAHDDPVRPGRLRRRGRRGRLARRLTRGARVARHAVRDGRPRRGRAQHRAGCRATATSTGSRSGRTSRRTSCPRSRTCSCAPARSGSPARSSARPR